MATTPQDKGVIALDADGVLLNYNLAYANAWERTFGTFPQVRDPQAYWPLDRWAVPRLTGEPLDRFRDAFDDSFWATIPALPGAVQACQQLAEAGYRLVCVTALPARHRQARVDNLRRHGFPLETVHTTGLQVSDVSPKAELLNALRPIAFVDDYLPFFAGVHRGIHQALVHRDVNGSPNHGELLQGISSTHADLPGFAAWWLGRAG